MAMRRAAAWGARGAGVRSPARWCQGAAGDRAWLEEENDGMEMTQAERDVHEKQQRLLKKHAEELNQQYEAEYERTTKQMETHQHKSAASVAALEAKIAELTAMIQQMKAESR